MRLRVRKWGNSLALRIPKAFAEEVRVEQGSEVDLSVDDGRLIASPVEQQTWTLRDLLSRVRKGNLHGEADFGESVGREVW
jgi:antitoxin MazE